MACKRQTHKANRTIKTQNPNKQNSRETKTYKPQNSKRKTQNRKGPMDNYNKIPIQSKSQTRKCTQEGPPKPQNKTPATPRIQTNQHPKAKSENKQKTTKLPYYTNPPANIRIQVTPKNH